jgi:hypothetical protein
MFSTVFVGYGILDDGIYKKVVNYFYFFFIEVKTFYYVKLPSK